MKYLCNEYVKGHYNDLLKYPSPFYNQIRIPALAENVLKGTLSHTEGSTIPRFCIEPLVLPRTPRNDSRMDEGTDRAFRWMLEALLWMLGFESNSDIQYVAAGGHVSDGHRWLMACVSLVVTGIHGGLCACRFLHFICSHLGEKCCFGAGRILCLHPQFRIPLLIV